MNGDVQVTTRHYQSRRVTIGTANWISDWWHLANASLIPIFNELVVCVLYF